MSVPLEKRLRGPLTPSGLTRLKRACESLADLMTENVEALKREGRPGYLEGATILEGRVKQLRDWAHEIEEAKS